MLDPIPVGETILPDKKWSQAVKALGGTLQTARKGDVPPAAPSEAEASKQPGARLLKHK